MDKKVLILLLTIIALMAANVAKAENRVNCDSIYFKDILNECKEDRFEPDTTVEHHETFSWGFYLDLILWETDHAEFGARSTFDYETSETRVYAGGKVYLNRLFWQYH